MNKMLTKMYLDQLKRNYSNPIQVIEKSSSLRGKMMQLKHLLL